MAREDTRERILVGAIELLRSRGYRGTTFDDIAGHVALSRSAIVWHFRTKPDLLTTLVTPLLQDVTAAITEAETVIPDHDMRCAFLLRLLETYLSHRGVVEWLLLDIGAHHDTGDLVGPSGELDRRIRGLLAPTRDLNGLLQASAALGAINRPLLNFPDADLYPHRHRIVNSAAAALTH